MESVDIGIIIPVYFLYIITGFINNINSFNHNNKTDLICKARFYVKSQFTAD